MTLAALVGRMGADLRRHPGASLAVAAACGAVVVLLGGARISADRVGVDRLGVGSGPAAAPVEVIAYLRDDAGAGAVAALDVALAQAGGVESVRRVAAGEALDRLRAALGPHARVLDAAEDGLLPASLEIALAPGLDAPARAHQIGERLRAFPGVIDVDEIVPRVDPAMAALAARAARLRPLLRGAVAGGVLAALLSIIAFRPARRRDEMRLLLSLGFTRAAAFLPAIGADTLAALVGAGVGLALLRLGSGYLAGAPAAAPAFAALPWAVPRACALVLAAAGLVGGLGGYLRARVPDPADG